ncbi:hypothetical protein F5887DRAFT_108682 [Amanita rubescens]|nr:hypothetical protein F5887DRAFT_108682 [Amanita rubescens]
MSEVPLRKVTIVENAPLSLNPQELEFFKTQTGLEEEELKKHIYDIQAKAYQVYPYPCIKSLSFAKLRIPHSPAYPSVLQLAKERKDAILLDAGCCFGCDLRKAVVDGWAVENVLGFELRKAFWDCGHELFRSTPESFPAAFVEGDVFDPAMISPRAPFNLSEALSPRPDLKSLTSLTPLQGHVSAIYTGAFFHLFDEPGQLQVARQLASLLSPLPGSIIFGGHAGDLVKGTKISRTTQRPMFFHSPESWKDLWEGQVFEKGEVLADARVIEISYKPVGQAEAEIAYWLVWSITRL